MLRRRTKQSALVAAVAAVAALALGSYAGAAAPKLSCKVAEAVARLPAKPAWFPSPQPANTTLVVDAAAAPGFAHGLRWTVGNRSFWLGRLPRGGTVAGAVAGSKAEIVFEARFVNLGRVITVMRRADGRLFARFTTNGSGPDATVVVARNITSTEFGEFLASLRKVRYPTGC